jgi:hypothetical protein
MANALKAIYQGEDYQALYFWLYASRLFQSFSKVAKVAYELNEIKSFDDIVVSYACPLLGERGNTFIKDYFQIKFHVNLGGAFTHKALIDPAFINASSESLLKKVQRAQSHFATNVNDSRLILASPWTIHPDDQLAKLISATGGAILLEKLFDGTTDGSTMGKVRALWRDHLNLTNNDDLLKVISPLVIDKNAPTLMSLADQVNQKLYQAGFVPVEADKLSNPYLELIRKLFGVGKNEFTRKELQAICEKEGLWRGTPTPISDAVKIGIRSFSRWTEFMEDETSEMLDLVPYFHNREILSQDLWNRDIFPCIQSFLSKYDGCSQPIHLFLDNHSSVAFAAGYCFERKSGTNIAPVQRTGKKREVWEVQSIIDPSSYPDWAVGEEMCNTNENDLAVAISITHDVSDDVKEYVTHHLPQVRKIISFTINPSPSSLSVRDGTHAFSLAESLTSLVRKSSRQLHADKVHIFASAPNAFMFFFGQLAHLLNSCTLYEYDFGTKSLGAYSRAITLPPRN